jgi:hypothetical protein
MSLSNSALELPRGALRLLRSSRFALTRPDAFGAGAFPLRSFAPLNDFAYVDRSIWGCDCIA